MSPHPLTRRLATIRSAGKRAVAGARRLGRGCGLHYNSRASQFFFYRRELGSCATRRGGGAGRQPRPGAHETVGSRSSRYVGSRVGAR